MKLIYVFVFIYAKCWYSHDAAHLSQGSKGTFYFHVCVCFIVLILFLLFNDKPFYVRKLYVLNVHYGWQITGFTIQNLSLLIGLKYS